MTNWFTEARYGMFVHWGAYSAAGRGEWVYNRENIRTEEYTARYVNHFKAERYDPAKWANLAKQAGMKYMVLTTKHHDGFALWDSACHKYNSVNYGPKRDLVRPYVDACRSAGLKVGLYLSGAEWTHPDYPDGHARDWPTAWRDYDSHKRFTDHIREQVRELMTGYGQIDILWWDGCLPKPFDFSGCNELAKQLQPQILINERNGSPCDFYCQEQSTKAKSGCWESCLTLNNNWGYHPNDHFWKRPQDVVRALVAVAGSGGNLLLNVGPRADGTVPEECESVLLSVGKWLSKRNSWLPNSERSNFAWNNWGAVTVKGNFVYMHIFSPPAAEATDTDGTCTICWPDLSNSIKSAKLLSTGSDLCYKIDGDRLYVYRIPAELEEGICTTVVLEVDGVPQSRRRQETFWIPE